MIALQILIYMYDKIKGTLQLNKITSLRKPPQWTGRLHTWEWQCWPPFLRPLHYTISSLPRGEKLPASPILQKEWRETQRKIPKLVSPTTPQVWFHEDQESQHLLCFSLKNRKSHALCRGFSTVSAQWPDKITASEKARICDLRLNW